MMRRDRVRKKEPADIDAVQAHPSTYVKKCALPYFQLLEAAEKERTRLHIHSTNTAKGLNNIRNDRLKMKAGGELVDQYPPVVTRIVRDLVLPEGLPERGGQWRK